MNHIRTHPSRIERRRRMRALIAILVFGLTPVSVFAQDTYSELATVWGKEEQLEYGGSEPSMDRTGMYIAFTSIDPMLTAGGEFFRHVYVRDRLNLETNLISRGKDGPADGPSFEPDIDSRSTHVAFTTQATNLECEGCDKNDTMDVYLANLKTGHVKRISYQWGRELNNASYQPSIAEDGSKVAFTSWADNVVLNDTNMARDVFVWINGKGVHRVSFSPQGEEFAGDSHSPQISVDGRFIVFVNETGPGQSDVYVRDLEQDKTFDVSRLHATTETGMNVEPTISTLGSYIAWSANGYGPKGESNPMRVFVRQMESTHSCSVICIQVHPHTRILNSRRGEQRQPQILGAIVLGVGFQHNTGQFGVVYTATDQDGSREVEMHFEGMFPEDNYSDVLSKNAAGGIADGDSYAPAVSRVLLGSEMWQVAFVSKASDLPVPDMNDAADVIYMERTE